MKRPSRLVPQRSSSECRFDFCQCFYHVLNLPVAALFMDVDAEMCRESCFGIWRGILTIGIATVGRAGPRKPRLTKNATFLVPNLVARAYVVTCIQENSLCRDRLGDLLLATTKLIGIDAYQQEPVGALSVGRVGDNLQAA